DLSRRWGNNVSAMKLPDPDFDADPALVLRYYAPYLNSRNWRWPLLGPSYHLFADALYWTDEAPPWSKPARNVENALRFLWYYRTGLILGEARDHVEYWDLGKRLFPRWIGFHPSRCKPMRQYKVIYRAGCIATARCLADVELDMDEDL